MGLILLILSLLNICWIVNPQRMAFDLVLPVSPFCLSPNFIDIIVVNRQTNKSIRGYNHSILKDNILLAFAVVFELNIVK